MSIGTAFYDKKTYLGPETDAKGRILPLPLTLLKAPYVMAKITACEIHYVFAPPSCHCWRCRTYLTYLKVHHHHHHHHQQHM
jgi:hypothetical protein